MIARVSDILAALDRIAPPELREDYDNVGLLAGHPAGKVDRALVALDLTEGVIEEAEREGAQLIVTHHPILFHARRTLREDDPEGALLAHLLRARLALIAAHTNYDNAQAGLNDALAEALGLRDICPAQGGMRVGTLCEEMPPQVLADAIRGALGGSVRAYIPRGAPPVRRLAVLGGAGGGMFADAEAAGAQAFLTGEVKHHEALAGVALNLTMLDGGHYETEHIAIKTLANRLQNALDALQYTVAIVQSAHRPFVRYDA